MENNDAKDSLKKEYDIQYNVHFDNSEDYSRSDSASVSESLSYGEASQNHRSNLSDSKHVLGEYQDGFLQELDLKMHKAVSFAQPELPKFQLNNFDCYNPILEDPLIKDDEVSNIINDPKDEIMGSVHESELHQEFSENQQFSEDEEDLGFCGRENDTNLLMESDCEPETPCKIDNKEDQQKFDFDVKVFKDQSSLKKISHSHEGKQFI